jgi:ABC-type transport system involved in multi-copper enzyme maturation permease subunit
MRQRVRNVYLIAWTLALEAWRRREIYAIVLVTVALVVGLRFVRFFDIESFGKFYREISLKVMNVTTAATVILLAARQLPREFSNRTIYPLLAKPVARFDFLMGKYCGVLAAGCFCYALFMLVFIIGSKTLQAPIQGGLFVQSIYLQTASLAVVAAMVFFLSMLLNEDAALTIAGIFYVASQVLMNTMSYLYDFLGGLGKAGLLALHVLIPQLTLFDLSSKVVHSIDGDIVVWGPLPATVLWQLTAYALVYIVLFLSGAYLLFRRRPL